MVSKNAASRGSAIAPHPPTDSSSLKYTSPLILMVPSNITLSMSAVFKNL